MSADLLIHATLTVSGDSALLPAADARIKALLVGEIFEGGFEEHHGDDALSYDFKVRGGVPFPAFALASQEFPQLAVVAEWLIVEPRNLGPTLEIASAYAAYKLVVFCGLSIGFIYLCLRQLQDARAEAVAEREARLKESAANLVKAGEMLQRQQATAAVMKTINASVADPQPVFESIVN